ncbi:Ku protein [Streptomyces sp. V17-9]|uniref:non-homologous end joining protein Ku n=1 Tax=Streptomyces sp. V17-9 TaxID=2831149 RepID=UPI001BB0AF1D|nr:Ku protein [Streptomyces sp. V17-9]QUW93699.1 Non-homologous end joining protein Ku [Streptomyces sp. V17-9]
MRSIWNGAISFGLVSIPIKLVNATESHAVSFRQIHTEDGGRIRYRKVCELEDREVTQAEIGKAYEDADGSMIPITDEDLSQLPIPTARTIEIVAFVPEDRIDPLQMGSAYYLAASGAPAAKPYTLLREALKRSNRVAIAKFALRGRERLGMLRVVGDAIAMHGLLWPDEVRAPEGVAPESGVTVRDQELDLADALMDTLGEIDLDDLHDEYREAVEEVVAAKAAGERPPEAREEAAPGKVLDLMAALENSVRAARESRDGEEAGQAEEAEVRSLPQRKTSSRRAPKETGGKKSTSTAAKKTAAKRAEPKKSTAKSGTARSSSTSSSTSSSRAASASASAKKTAAKGTAKKAAGRSTAKETAKSTGRSTAKKTASRRRSA